MRTLRSQMHRFLLVALACGIVAGAARATTNQWTAIGPVGATISSIASVGTMVYAGTSVTGVLRSADGGATWRLASEGLTDPSVRALAVDPQTPTTLYAGTASGLFKSVDGAAHWMPAGFQDSAHRSVNAIAVDAAQSQVLFAATSAGLYRSVDGAQTWAAIGFGDYVGNDVAVDPASPGVVYFSGDQVGGAGSGIYRSADAGMTWTKIRPAPINFDDDGLVAGPGHIYVDPTGSGRTYVAYAGNGIFITTNGGTTWSALAVPIAIIPSLAAFAVDRGDANSLYLGTSDGKLLRSADGGGSWTDTTTTPQSGRIVVLAARHATIYAGATNGLFTSTDAGATWNAADLGVRRIPSGPLLVDPTAPSTIYASVDDLLVKSADAGAHWMSIGSPPGRVVALALDPPSTLYAGTSDLGVPTLFKSVDGGIHWSTILDQQVRLPVSTIAIARKRASTIYVSVQGAGIIKSVDAGANGVFVNNDLGDAATFARALAIDPSDADVVYAGGYTGRSGANVLNVYKSINGGNHWQPIPVDVPVGSVVSRIAIDPAATSLYATLLDAPLAGAIYKSVQAGATWFPASAGLPPRTSITAFVVDPANPERLYAGASTGVYRSIDAGATWAPLDAGQPMRDVSDLALDTSGKVLRAATASGLFEYRFTDDSPDVVTVVEYHNSVFDHYFITSDAGEIATLDRDVASAWVRTGAAFHAFAAPSSATVPVCRFFSTAFAPKSSHFYSPFADECALERGDPHWQLETADAFDMALPSPTGECASGSMPVYRLYNNGQGGAPNHRYTTDQAVRAQMIAKGWVPEGLGPEAVQMCAPQ